LKIRRKSSAEAKGSSREPKQNREASLNRNLSQLYHLPPVDIPLSLTMKVLVKIKLKRKWYK